MCSQVRLAKPSPVSTGAGLSSVAPRPESKGGELKKLDSQRLPVCLLASQAALSSLNKVDQLGLIMPSIRKAGPRQPLC